MGWQVTVGDLTWAEEDVTVDEAVDICRVAGGGWEMLDPLAGPASAAGIVSVLLAKHGAPLEQAVKEVAAMPAVELLGCFVGG